MKPSSKRNQQLIKQYPFVSDILSARMEPFGGQDGIKVDDLSIRVEKADGDLMFRRADNIGLGDASCIFSMKGSRKNQVQRQGEYLFAIDDEARIINRVDWPRNDKERGDSEEIYGWSALWLGKSVTHSGGWSFSNSICNKTKYLVWVTVKAWYTDTRNNDSPLGRFGDFIDRLVDITIYGQPEQGFSKLQEESNVYKNLFLDNRIMTSGAIKKNHDIITIGGMLYEMCLTFQDQVYFNGMKDKLDAGDFRGASGQFGSVKVMCAEMCGYDRVMLEDNISYVTFQLRPGSKHMYVLGQQGTLPQIRNLVRTVVQAWNQSSELRDSFKPDQNVSVM